MESSEYIEANKISMFITLKVALLDLHVVKIEEQQALAYVRTRPEKIRESLKPFYQKTVELCEIL